MLYFAIDFGKRHCGVALARSYLSESIGTFPTHQTIDKIIALANNEKIDAIVIGMPEGETGDAALGFSKLIKTKQIPVIYVDETLSSQETRTSLAKHGVKRSVRQGKTDHYVAARLLDEYLQSINQSL